ncbi:MAG: helix-turn-helix transcriptional regulator [Rhizobiales bacterium]|nr:helix-turn-helix transcriptional regulator [Hyphomicrobiales bacterium]
MKLKTWLTQADISRADFADEIGVNKRTITRYLDGDRKPGADIFSKIFDVTKGNVTPNDFYDLPAKVE